MEKTVAFLSPHLAKQARIYIASNGSKESRLFHYTHLYNKSPRDIKLYISKVR